MGVACTCGGRKPGDEKLLRYLYENKHATPFEMAGMVIEVQAPILVFRQWHRHRTQCLAPDTLVHFDAPKSKANRRSVYKLTIEDIWKRWQPTTRKTRPERQTNAFHKRNRVRNMQLRCLDEERREISHTRIIDVIKGEPKPMVRVTTASGRTITATRAHRFMTNIGWMTLGKAIDEGHLLTLEGTTRSKAMRWEVPKIVEEIVSVEDIGELPTYDLTVEGPYHNFVADGFVVHNSYNEMSARYTPLPDVNYTPTVERCIVVDGKNKQAGKANKKTPTHAEVIAWLEELEAAYRMSQRVYARGLEIGIPKEVARCPVPVARYSRMRASANLRNWLAFMTLRSDSHAQHEIRVFSDALGVMIQKAFPRTYALWCEGRERTQQDKLMRQFIKELHQAAFEDWCAQ